MVNDPQPSNSNQTDSPENYTILPENIQQLLADFNRLYDLKNSVHLEYELFQSAKHYDLPLEHIRQMFKEYCRQRKEEVWETSRLLFLFLRIERKLESLNQFMSQMALFPILENLSKLSIIVALIVFVWEIPERAQQRASEQNRANYEAWRVILESEDKQASGGRIKALQDLNKQKIRLSNTNLLGAFLAEIELPKAILDGANLEEAILNGANLQNSIMINTNLKKANLIGTDLSGSDLFGANLFGTNLSNAILIEADLTQADLREAKGLTIVQLKQAKNWQSACYSPELREQLGLTSVKNNTVDACSLN